MTSRNLNDIFSSPPSSPTQINEDSPPPSPSRLDPEELLIDDTPVGDSLEVNQIIENTGEEEEEEEDTLRVILGTTIVLEHTIDRVKDFLCTYEDDSREKNYVNLLNEILQNDIYHLNVNAQHLKEFNETLYNQLILYPQEIIPIMDTAVNEIIEESGNNMDDSIRIQVRVFNLTEKNIMRELSPDDIDRLISVKGMIIRSSSIIPDMKQAFFECSVCQHFQQVNIDRGTIHHPDKCQSCSARGCMDIIYNRCIYSDKQMVKLQETPDSIPEGELPHSVTLYVYDTLCDLSRPGDRVEITGIFRAVPSRRNPQQRNLKTVFKTYIDVIHMKKIDTFQADMDTPITYFSADRIELLKELSQKPDIYELLVNSFAPNIWELDDIKKGLLCQLFGGTSKRFSESGSGRFRGEINILLCGDPGTSKSQLLSYVHKLTPRGIYTSGKGSSAVGLTAYVTKDVDTGEAVLESGALVLSDKGICCIDEFDKMNDQTRSILHEVMEQQTVSVAKAGIICSLNSRTSVLASANPVESKYNPSMSVVDNIQLPPTLISRFDVIYLVLDKPNEISDRQLAKHLISLYFKTPTKPENIISAELLRDYIAYSKQIQPKLSDGACKTLVDGYVSMRKLGGNKKTITATPRQLESLIRLSEARARMRWSESVEVEDVEEAIRLVKVGLKQAAIDPETGTIDMDLITTGKSKVSRERLDKLTIEIEKLLSDDKKSFKDVLQQINDQSSLPVSPSDLQSALQHLVGQSKIIFSKGLISSI